MISTSTSTPTRHRTGHRSGSVPREPRLLSESADAVEHALRLLHARDRVDVPADLVLEVVGGVAGVRTLRGGRAPFAAEPDVLVVPDLLFGEPVEDLVLLVPEPAHPVPHVLHHLALHGGVGLVEVGVEPGGRIAMEFVSQVTT